MPADAHPASSSGPPPSTSARPRRLRSVAVVGAGLAGSRTVVALRDQGFEGTITLLGAEGVEPYDRPPLSKELLTRTEPAWLRAELGGPTADPADPLGAEVRLADPALGLTVGTDEVAVRTGAGTLTADAVVLATGATAVHPPAWGACTTLHTAADAARLRGALGPGRRLVVVGAGWIGAEVAGVAARAGVDVTVVEAAGAPLSAALGEEVGALTIPWYAASGVDLRTGQAVVRVDEHTVELDDGSTLEADVVLAAVGARPASGWLEPTLPLTASGALSVDPAWRVLGPSGPLDHVLAVGDLATRWSPRHGWVPGGHWDGALRGPAVAVAGLLGRAEARAVRPDGAVPGGSAPESLSLEDAPVEDPAPYVFSTQLGHEVALYGQPGLGDDVVLRGDPNGPFTALWFHRGSEQLTAVLAVDRPRDVAAARRLFSGPALPYLDRGVAADPSTNLRAAAGGHG